MVIQEFVEKIALFFHLSLLNEARAQSLTVNTIKKFRRQQIKAKISGKNFKTDDLVRFTAQQLKREKNQANPPRLAFSAGALLLPEKSNFGPWFEFRKVADEKDFSAVLYSKVLQLSDEDIASGLAVSVGTVRFRVAKGLKTLGRICYLGGRENEA